VSREPISVIVSASGRAADFRRCLESLRPTLGWQDEAVCVVPPGRPDLDEVLSTRRWLPTVSTKADTQPVDQADRWAAGLAATSRDVVVLLDGDVQVTARWLDAIAEAFAEPDVVAAGPRCHRSFGPQLYDIPEPAASDPAGFKAFARVWRERHRGQLTTVSSLGPVCVAVRRDALARAGGPGYELPYANLRDEGRLVLVEGALLGHDASEECALRRVAAGPRPLLSACLIVKDEEDVLAECLTSVRDFVDEIVVYDTGSTDRTRDLAAEHGAQVITGFWDDHFGNARNRALEHCTGEWALQIDADEVALGDPAELRALLSATGARVFRIALESQQGHAGAEASMAMLYPRLFRRVEARYVHRLHEQVVDRVDGHLLHGEPIGMLRILHSGYIAQRLAIKQKLSRNLHLARLSADDAGAGAAALINIGRAEKATGRFEAAAEALRAAADARDATRPMRVLALKTLIEALLALGRFDEANGALEELRRMSTKPVTVTQSEAAVRFHELKFEQSLRLVQEFPESATDDAGIVVGRANFAEIEIKCLFYLDRIAESAQVLRDCLRAGRLPLNMAEMRDLLAADGSGLAEVAGLIPHHHLRGLLFRANDAPAELADEMLEALWTVYGGEPVILAFASEVAPRRTVIRALEWSARLRAAGIDDRCPLVALAASNARTPRDRTVAAAVALEMFGDRRAAGLLADALAEVPEADEAAVLDELRVLAPGILEQTQVP
jgi:tetratricopeptide (TPR) repeat protein